LRQIDFPVVLSSRIKSLDRTQSWNLWKVAAPICCFYKVSEIIYFAPWWSKRLYRWFKMFAMATFILILWSNVYFKMLTFWENCQKLIFSTEIRFFAVLFRKIRLSQNLKNLGPQKPHASAIVR
jgi:hypothetical protein